jgi:hypothetical protein
VINTDGCLSPAEQPQQPGQPVDVWTVLRAPHAGTYRIAAPYKLPRGTACPDADPSKGGSAESAASRGSIIRRG